jgi:hypothetical protein
MEGKHEARKALAALKAAQLKSLDKLYEVREMAHKTGEQDAVKEVCIRIVAIEESREMGPPTQGIVEAESVGA